MAEFNFSVFTQAVEGDADVAGFVEAAEETLRSSGRTEHWRITTDGFWCFLTPRGQLGPEQGWKLHVSATPASAETVLARSLPVLMAESSSFKFAKTIDHVGHLNARHTSRGHSGKFITVYPRSDEEAVRLAGALHEATKGLPGPRILSDRPYALDSIVHFRYGAFVEKRKLSDDGLYSWVILDPDGNPVEDRRIGRYVPPAWAKCPFPDLAVQATETARSEGGVLLADRFLVREAIRHVNKGGVYRAVDTETGAQAIIKEARPHVASDMSGRDVRDLLRAETRALEKLGPLGVAPRVLMLFEHSQHLYLAEELVPGTSLREWVLDRIRHNGWRRHLSDAPDMARRLVELMSVAHHAGVILRDFNPNNVMVLPDGQLRLVDLELAVLSGQQDDTVTGAGTPGYAAPEQMKGEPPALAADFYSLGATLCFVFTGSTPDLMSDSPEGRPLRERLAGWLAVREAPGNPAVLTTLVQGLMDEDPGSRWTTAEARDALGGAGVPSGRTPRTPARDLADDGGRLSEEAWLQAVTGSVDYLLASMRPADDERLWLVSCASGASDPCAVQVGAAGILGVLTRCFELTGEARLAEAIATAGSWLARRLEADATRSPGLYFGEAGIAWALYDAGRALGDARLVERGIALAETLPVSAPNPDITHGTAGIGLTFLHFWLRTNRPGFTDRVHGAADALVAAAREEPDGSLIWGTPAAFDSRLPGGKYYGYAHGTAGVGYFMLAAALATGRSDCLALARQAGETLLANVNVVEGMAQWGAGPGDPPTAPYWCHGSAGIGSFLARLHRVTRDDRFDKLADMSARAVVENSWRGVLGQCHGLAGNGEFLLDMAEHANGRPYEAMAHQLARIIFASRAHRQGWVVFPDEHGDPSPTWADGASGILSFLLRLRHRSPRAWMVDGLLERSFPS